ncbi:MAG TPA: ATP-binding protein [Rhodocyclaceae bacterium]
MIRIPSLLFLAALAWAAAVHAAPLDEWRARVIQTRALADNDPSRAYVDAKALESALPSGATAADRAAVLNVRSRIEVYLAMSEEAARHAELALDISRQHEDRIGQVEADLNLALASVNLGRIDRLVAVTTHAMTLIDGMDRPELVAEAMLRTGTMYGRIGDFDPSITMPLQALDIAQRSNNALALAYAHQGMAIALAQTDHQAQVLGHYEQMRDYARAAHSTILETDATLGIGNSLAAQGKLREGEALIREALAVYRAFRGPFYIGHALNTLAWNLKQQGRAAEAAPLFDEAFAIYERSGNNTGLWWMLMARSGDRQAAGQLAEAAGDARRAYTIARELGTRFYQARSARRLAAVFAAQGDFRRAYAMSAEAGELTDTADKERAGTRLTDLAQRYRTEAKQREIEELERRSEQQAAEQVSLWIGLAASMVLLAAVSYFLLQLRRKRRLLEAANARLRDSQQEIQALNVGLEQRVQARTAELRQQARYLRTLIDMLPMWAWFKDTQSRYLVTNQAHAAARGISADEMAGKSDFDIAPRALAESQRADDAAVMLSGQRRTTEELLPDGSRSRWMEVYKAPVADEDGTLLGTVGVARDISERKAADEARNAALAEAERLAKLRSDFLAQMSHELRTPLNGILGYAQLLANAGGLDERQVTGLAVIHRCGEQLLALVNDILDMAKIEAGKLEVQPSRVPLQAFLAGITEMVGVRAEQKGLLFTCELAADLPEAVDVDERLLRQVLLNLLANAIKFTDRGRVSLRVAREPNGRLRFAVEDSGIGIASDHLKRIFAPFERADGNRQDAEGAGLGLSISRQFVSRLGGEIFVSSEPGKGSVFWFELDMPDAAAPVEMPAARRIVSGYEGPRRRILAADDLPDNRQLIADMLEPLGFDVVQAGDGLEALHAAAATLPDLILLDTRMPRMDGFETMRKLRQIPGVEGIPIIAISASASAAEREDSFLMGANEVLAKPLRMDALLDRIGSLLQLRWIHRDPAAASPFPAPDRALVPPPLEHMETLHHLALQGNMRDILGHADVLLQLDTRYHPFARRLRELASGYQSRAILELVNAHLEGNRAA